jgi:hypothetical protein
MRLVGFFTVHQNRTFLAVTLTTALIIAVVVLVYRSRVNLMPSQKDLRKATGSARLASLERLANQVEKGMSKQQVLAILGATDNSDSQFVWMWVANSDTAEKKPWLQLHMGPGFFLLFKEDRVISPFLKNAETTPWEALREATGYSKADAEAILGREPRIERR